MMTFNGAEILLKGQDRRKIALNTWLFRRNPDVITIRLYETDILTMYRDGRYMIQSQGQRSALTKKRLNKYSPVHIHQKKKMWYIGLNEFFDGIEVNERGSILNGG